LRDEDLTTSTKLGDRVADGETYAIPTAEVLSKARHAMAVLFAHPTERGLVVGKAINSTSRVRIDVMLKDLGCNVASPSGSSPNVDW
jgi:hypothetical protein